MNDIILWHLNIDEEEAGEYKSPDIGYSGNSNLLLKLEFDINHKLEVVKKTLKATYEYEKNIKYIDKKSAEISAVDSEKAKGSKLTSQDIIVGRRLNLCDEALSHVDEENMSGDSNTFSCFGDVKYPGIHTFTALTTRPPIKHNEKLSNMSDVVNFQFPYEFEKERIEGTLDLPLIEAPGGVLKTRVKYKYELSRKKLELRYFPLKKDARSITGNFLGYKRITNNVAKASMSEWFIHANNEVRVLVEGRNVTNNFIIWRYARVWNAKLNKNKERNEQYKTSSPPWVDDNISKSPKEWVDHPGRIMSRTADSWPMERQLDEFVVGVHQFPEFGFLYFIVVIDTMPNECRVRTYYPEKIDLEDLCKLKQSEEQAPFLTDKWKELVESDSMKEKYGTDSGWWNSAKQK